jgi:hypothetical protein
MRFSGDPKKVRKITGLRALYFYYLYKMGVLPKTREPNPKRVYFLFREDIRHIQAISRETRLLAAHGIDTVEQLREYKASAKDWREVKMCEAIEQRSVEMRDKLRQEVQEQNATKESNTKELVKHDQFRGRR